MPPLRIGPFRLGVNGARRLGVTLGALAAAGGVALGVASAAPDGGPPVSGLPVTGPPAASATPRSGPATTGPSGALARIGGRRPLHQLVTARLRAGEQRAPGGSTVVLGRLLEVSATSATVAVGGGQTRTVRFTPETRRPARRPMAGDVVLVIGRLGVDGTVRARAVLVRPDPEARRAQRRPA